MRPGATEQAGPPVWTRKYEGLLISSFLPFNLMLVRHYGLGILPPPRRLIGAFLEFLWRLEAPLSAPALRNRLAMQPEDRGRGQTAARQIVSVLPLRSSPIPYPLSLQRRANQFH